MITSKQLLRFVSLVEGTLAAQQRYFKEHRRDQLIHAKGLESRLRQQCGRLRERLESGEQLQLFSEDG